MGINKLSTCVVSVSKGASESLLVKYCMQLVLSIANVFAISLARSALVLTLFKINLTLACWLFLSILIKFSKLVFLSIKNLPGLILSSTLNNLAKTKKLVLSLIIFLLLKLSAKASSPPLLYSKLTLSVVK